MSSLLWEEFELAFSVGDCAVVSKPEPISSVDESPVVSPLENDDDDSLYSPLWVESELDDDDELLVEDEELEFVFVEFPYEPCVVDVKSPLLPVPIGYPPVFVVEGFESPYGSSPGVEATSVLLAHGSFSSLCSSLYSFPIEPPSWAPSLWLDDGCS